MYIKLSPEAKSMLKIYYEDYLKKVGEGVDPFAAREINCEKITFPIIKEMGFYPFLDICNELRAAKLMVYIKNDEEEVVLWAQISERAVKYMSGRKRGEPG